MSWPSLNPRAMSFPLGAVRCGASLFGVSAATYKTAQNIARTARLAVAGRPACLERKVLRAQAVVDGSGCFSLVATTLLE